MTESPVSQVRVLVAVVSHGRSKLLEEQAKSVTELLRGEGFHVVRNVVAQGESTYIEQLVSNVSNDNEADAIVMLGGTGLGPRDNTCEALNSLFERRIEGFGDAVRALFTGPRAMLSRATAGVFNRCLVFALSGRSADVTRAVKDVIVPALPEAVELATGRLRPHDTRASEVPPAPR
jgi:molybdenum cofactor biosynthesis protein B